VRAQGRCDARCVMSNQTGYDYTGFSQLAGALEAPPPGAYRVQYRRLPSWRPLRTLALVICMVASEVGFLIWLLLPQHWPHHQTVLAVHVIAIGMVAILAVIEIFRLLNVFTVCLATLRALDPIPVVPEPGTRVAFLTTIVPSKEPLAIAARTLEAATHITHDGTLDVWLLDEGDDDEVRATCAQLGVHHFTRKGVAAWNVPSGPHKAKTKHGNLNAWLAAHGDDYDVLISVDPDHIPLPNMCERLLGYFRDPDVAFVVGPQVYGNYDNLVTKCAESQQYLFHSLLQRAGNFVRSPMLVGTNNAIRIAALRNIGGLQDSITEDLATSLVFHTRHNVSTGRRWTSVYTPDVLAVGEGPSSWTDFFTQQYRWSRGGDEVFFRQFGRAMFRLAPGQLVHYIVLLSYYPTIGTAWLLGTINSVLYLTLGTGGVIIDPKLWLMFYADVLLMQIAVYLWLRRYNISPHEKAGSSGTAGMFISAITVPVYVTSLCQTLRGRATNFVVTPKGAAMSVDSWRTFRLHLTWATVIALPLVASISLGHSALTMRVWSFLAVLVCAVPVLIWRFGKRTAQPAEAAGDVAPESELNAA
jgi:cellulose synthase/poly-beta-1,6-N-acetylglucosamine synthase-like glycosyltransferase